MRRARQPNAPTPDPQPGGIAFQIGLGAERRPDHDAADSARRRRLAAEEKRLRI